MFSIDSRAIPIYISEATLLFVLFSSSGVSLRWFIRHDANRTLVCPCFWTLSLGQRINFFLFLFFSHNSVQNRNWISKNPVKGLMNREASSMKVPNVSPSVNIFRIQETLEAISTTLLAEKLLSETAPFFKRLNGSYGTNVLIRATF